MKFEFLIVYQATEDLDIRAIVVDALSQAFEENLHEFDEDAVGQMVELRCQRTGDESTDEDGKASMYTVLGMAVELPEETSLAESVLDEFSSTMQASSAIQHVVRFEDPLLEAELTRRAGEIFALEMKLRRVLSLVYLHAYQDGSPYELLRDEIVKPMTKEPPSADQMAAAGENQFFHLTFSDYIKLNQRQDQKLRALIDVIRTAEQYEAFRSEITRTPVQHEDDAVLLAGLKERMDAIEQMRNCVAHNRRPTPRVAENYRNAYPLVGDMLDNYLAQWELGPNSGDQAEPADGGSETTAGSPPSSEVPSTK